MDISKLLNLLISNLPSKELLTILISILISISLASGILLFSRDSFLQRIGLDNFQAQFKEWIGVAFLVSNALLVSVLAVTLFQWVRSGYSKFRESRRRKTQRKKIFQTLTPVERKILRGYVVSNSQTQYFDIGDGVIAGLEHKGIIYQATRTGFYRSWAYNITSWAWEFLQKHPEILLTEELVAPDKQEVAQILKDMGITEKDLVDILQKVSQASSEEEAR